MTTSPDGELVPVEQRLAEIHDRYGSGHLVSRSFLPARHADDPLRSRAGPAKGRPGHIAPRIGGRLMPCVALCGSNLAPGMAPKTCSIRSSYFSELEPRYGIEP